MIFEKIKVSFRTFDDANMVDMHTEKILSVLLLVCVFFLIISQVGLTNESVRTFFTSIDKYEGINVNQIESMFQQGEITLLLSGIKPTKDIKILINGYETLDFNTETITFKVRNNCIIEIDGTKIKAPFKVKIIGISNNIRTQCLNHQITINSNIEILTRIFLTDKN